MDLVIVDLALDLVVVIFLLAAHLLFPFSEPNRSGHLS